MIPIDEQIARVKRRIKLEKELNAVDPKLDDVQMYEAILASLEELKRIREVQVPEEPEFIKRLIQTVADTHALSISCSVHLLKAIVEYIDTLRDLLKQCKHNSSVTMDELGEMRERAEAAEATIAAMLKLGEVKENGVVWDNQNPHSYPIGTAFYAKMAEQAGVKK